MFSIVLFVARLSLTSLQAAPPGPRKRPVVNPLLAVLAADSIETSRRGPRMFRAHDQHAFASFHPRELEGLTITSRRNLLKAGLAGLAGLSLPGLLRQRALAA